MITSEKLVGSENYLSWSASVELWFMGQGYEDHLVTQEADIPEAKGLYTNDIQRPYKVASTIVHISQQDVDLSTYIGQIVSLKEEFLTVMPLTPDVGAQQTQLDKFFMVLTLIGLRPDLEPIRDQILGSSSVLSLDDFLNYLEEDAVVPEVEANVLIAPIAIKLGHTRDRCYQLHGRPPRTAHMAQSSDSPLPQPPSSSTSQTSQASIASVAQPGSFLLYYYYSALPTVTLANGSQTVAKGIGLALPLPSLPLTSDRSTGKTIGIGLLEDGPSFFHFVVASCESCQLGKHTRVSFPKRLNNRAKSPFELVHTDVWGLCRTASTLGFQYFVTFIDDYSRLTMPGNIFQPHLLRFMSHYGILHQSSCAHTPQQNGVAERKNRHLIPHSLLFPDQPLYFLPPRVFGCTCFVHILTPGQDKLSAKAMKCLFLGYSRLQKGYRCYSLETHRYFMSADLMSCLPRPLQVYHRRPRVAAPLPFAEAPADSLPTPSASPAPALPSPDDLPIAIRKDTRSTRWRQAMVDEMAALHSNATWDLVVLPSGYTQVYGSDYGDTFSPIAKIASFRLLLSMAVMCSWPLYQLDIKNAFLHGDLVEEVYMKQPPGFVAQGESGLVCSTADHSVFYHHNSLEQCIYLVVYVNDIVITGSDQDGIQKLKQHLFTHFQTKDLGKLKYFLGIEIAQSSSGVVLSQRKYALDILEETGMLDCKPVDTPIDPNVKLVPGQGEPLGDPGRYRRLVGQGVLYENRGHTQVVGYTDADWAGHPQIDVPLQGALHIACNPVFHERTKHIEVDCHFIREKIASGCVATSFVNSNDQLADIFTKSLSGPRIKYICNSLGAYDIYAPA
ncbi:Retrovirus-related Pol polyprotein from transposon RE1 [Vitis vinifera]|uniref:Retrovirus-related Pol polyprotein from transposon RE1 n=1 Tax=Vitis vinifera TaxID=29760 RepID=A0A438JR24_VITVI|nr:Retrovirus-related Pol polyprotein from transposon RE1 [Vitis vinifera]